MLPDGVMMIFHFKPTLRSDVSVQQLLLITVKYSVILYYTTSCSKTEYVRIWTLFVGRYCNHDIHGTFRFLSRQISKDSCCELKALSSQNLIDKPIAELYSSILRLLKERRAKQVHFLYNDTGSRMHFKTTITRTTIILNLIGDHTFCIIPSWRYGFDKAIFL